MDRTHPVDWPEVPRIRKGDPDADAKLELYKAKLDVIKAEYQANLDRTTTESYSDSAKAAYDNYYAVSQAIHQGYVDVAEGAIDRSLQRASYVETAAAAIGTAYAAVLALSFSIDKGVALPLTGLTPTIFLGMAFFLSAVYVSFLTKPRQFQQTESGGTLNDSLASQQNDFIAWANSAVQDRRFFLQAAVVSLGIGILCLPLPYLQIASAAFWWLVVIGVVITFLTTLGFDLRERGNKPNTDLGIIVSEAAEQQ
jgi:hypothetical protein